MTGPAKKRRSSLVERGGRHLFTVRAVVWLDKDGMQWTSLQVTGADGMDLVSRVEVLTALLDASDLVAEVIPEPDH